MSSNNQNPRFKKSLTTREETILVESYLIIKFFSISSDLKLNIRGITLLSNPIVLLVEDHDPDQNEGGELVLKVSCGP